MPLAAQGFAAIANGISYVLRRSQTIARIASCAVVAGIIASVVFLPLPLPEAATLSDFPKMMQKYNDPAYKTSFLTQEERDFIAKPPRSPATTSC